MKLVKVRGDGNCMYRAVGQAYQALTTGALAPRAAENAMASELRAMVAEYIRNHPKIVEGTHQFLLRPPSNRRSTATFAKNMAAEVDGGRWGEELELTVLQTLLRHPIKVYDEDGATFLHDVFSVNALDRGKEPLRVAYEGGLHYNALVPDATKNAAAPRTPRTPSPPPKKRNTLPESEAKALHHKLHRNVYLSSLAGLGANREVLALAKSLSLPELRQLHASQRANMVRALAGGDPIKKTYHDAMNKRQFMLRNLEARREYAEAVNAPAPTLTAAQQAKVESYTRVINKLKQAVTGMNAAQQARINRLKRG